MKSLNFLILTILLAFSLNNAFAEIPSVTVFGNQCDILASEAAGSWRNACLEMAQMDDGYISDEERAACRQAGEEMYDSVFKQCISSMLNVFHQPTFQ